MAGRRVDFVGAALCALGLGGVVFALIEQPRYGWSSPVISIPLAGGVVAFAAFLVYESRTSQPMLQLDLFRRRNFAVGNVETLAMYGGPRDPVLLPRDLPAAGRRLQRARRPGSRRCR